MERDLLEKICESLADEAVGPREIVEEVGDTDRRRGRDDLAARHRRAGESDSGHTDSERHEPEVDGE